MAKAKGLPIGVTWRNPLWYRKYRIYNSDLAIAAGVIMYVHDDYDGAEDANDNRCGWAKSINEVIDEIDELEDE